MSRRPPRVAAVMVGTLLVAALAAILADGSRGTIRIQRDSTGVAGCGFERWPVKTLADPGARTVRVDRVRPSRVAALVRLPVAQGGQTTRGAVIEKSVYRISAYLEAAKVEADSDIHLALRDPVSEDPMIAEIPALGCTVGAAPANRKAMERARAAFLKACGDPGNGGFTHYRPRLTVTVRGVGFFDFNHGQLNVARNAIELHPVLAISVHGCR